MRTALILVPIALLTGCIQSKSETTGIERQRRSIQEDGVQGGVPFSRTMTESVEIDRSSKTEKTTGLDEAAVARIAKTVVSAALEGATGGVSKEGIAAIAGGGTSLGLAVLAFLKHREASMHKADSDEAWKQLVPTSAKV